MCALPIHRQEGSRRISRYLDTTHNSKYCCNCYIVSYHILSYLIISHNTTLCHIMTYLITSRHIISNQPVSRELRCCSTTTLCTTLSLRSSSPSCPMTQVSYRPLHLLYRPPHLVRSEETLFPYYVGGVYSDYWNVAAMLVTSCTSTLSISQSHLFSLCTSLSTFAGPVCTSLSATSLPLSEHVHEKV